MKKKYNNNENISIIDLDLRNVPDNIDQRALKRLAGAKHVIETELQEDHMKGTLTGNGRMKIRLNHDENMDNIRKNLKKLGISANLHNVQPGKNPKMTQETTLELR